MRYLITAALTLPLFFSCTKEIECNQLLLFTEEVSDINSDGATFSAKQIDKCECEVGEYGFVWDTKPNPTLETSEKFLIREPKATKGFNQKITTTFRKGEIYYVRSFIKNSELLMYGNEVAFSSKGSKGPIVNDFFPKNGNLVDTVTVTGSNFSYINEKNVVTMGGQFCKTISANQDTIKFIISDKLNIASTEVVVSISGNKTHSTKSFHLISPVINDFWDKNGSFNSKVTIAGDNFLSNPNTLRVYFNDKEAEILDLENQQLIVNVPNELNAKQSKIKVVMNNIEEYSNHNFQLAPVVLHSFYPEKALTGGIVTLKGNNFSPIAQNNIVSIGGIQVNVNKANINEIEITLPSQEEIMYPSRNLSVNVEVAEQKQAFVKELIINDQWFRLRNAPEILSTPGYSFSYLSCFSSDQKVYIGLNNSNVFCEYNPLKDEWKQLKDFPGYKRFNGAGFVIGDNVFFGTGSSPSPYHVYYKDWWKYNIKDNTWTQLRNFYGKERSGAVGFKINNSGYVGTGNGKTYSSFFNDVWRYDESADSWSRIADYPEKMTYGIGLITDSYAYVGLGLKPYSDITYMYRYDAGNDAWTQITDFPDGKDDNLSLGFVINDQVYASIRYWYLFYKYNEPYQYWSQIHRPDLIDNRHAIAFSINGKGYVGLGMNNWMWEFDPSR